MQNDQLTHFDAQGQAHMVDVGAKQSTQRNAIAEGHIFMSEAAFACVLAGDNKKGDVLGIARIAAIQASKQTAFLIPLCHPIALTHVAVKFELYHSTQSIRIQVTTENSGQTGVEMEALCAVNIGLLTIYDMLKAIDKNMKISDIQLLHKAGGRSGDWHKR